MTTRPHLEAGRDRLHHHWRCTRPPAVEHIETDATGQAVVVASCPSCGGTDLAQRTETDR